MEGDVGTNVISLVGLSDFSNCVHALFLLNIKLGKREAGGVGMAVTPVPFCAGATVGA